MRASVIPKSLSAKGEERARRIVRQGAEILLHDGLRAVNKRRIAAALDISDGNVSYYFPTRDDLWSAVLEYEIEEYFRRFHSSFLGNEYSAQERFDDYIRRWVDEYEDRMVRVFFSQILTIGETIPLVAHFRDRVYRIFFEQLLNFANELSPRTDSDELQQRVLLVMAVLEGLHAVTAFQPHVMGDESTLIDRVVHHVNQLIKNTDCNH